MEIPVQIQNDNAAFKNNVEDVAFASLPDLVGQCPTRERALGIAGA